MNKNGFVQIITHPNEINEQALKTLKSLGSKYPYSEVVHVMIAKGSSIQSSGKPGKELSIAALYSTDRSILKNVLVEKSSPAISKSSTDKTKLTPQPAKKSEQSVKTSPVKTVQKSASSVKSTTKASQQNQVAPKEKTKPATLEVKTKPETHKVKSKPADSQVNKKKPVIKTEVELNEAQLEHEREMDALRDELFHNLEELQKSKSHFVELFGDSGSSTKKRSTTTTKKKAPPKKAVKKTTSSSSLKSQKTNKEPVSSTQDKEIVNSSTEEIDSDTIDALIENLESKRKEENEKKGNDPQNDLSEHSVEFGDDLVSENLAKIMIKQGKNDKAIDIYKKLIWKFPQKKAYFASQIEKLKEE